MRHISVFALATLLLSEIPLLAQYPGQYPPGGGGYPGQYPPGQYPGGSGTGIPFPRRGKKKTTTKESADPVNLEQITGVLRQLEDKTIIVTADDHRDLSFKRSSTTKFLKKGEAIAPTVLKPGDHVMVEASKDDEGYLSAVRVNLEKEGTAAEREQASRPVEVSARMSPKNDDEDRPILRRKDSKPADVPEKAAETKPRAPEPAKAEEPASPPERADVPVVESDVPIDTSDPGAPKLRRGGRATSHKAPAEPVQVASNDRPTVRQSERPVEAAPKVDPRIEKAREAAMNFTESLPAYVCTEQIARFVSTTHKVDWRPVDIVSTEVIYENHKEQYRNIAINGKPAKKSMEEMSGSWSTGEFGTVLADLFSPATAADFKYKRQAKTSGRDAFLFDFEVEREGSHWRVQVPSQSLMPAYRGSVWVDKATSRVLRIEMEAVQVPKEFPLDKVESATDYQFVRIGDREFLLPIHSEVLSCERGSSDCSRNVIDFRNYHKYAGESNITFENK